MCKAIHPFSANAEAAAEYLALSLDHLQTSTRYSIFEDLNEPLRYPDFEETKESMRGWLEEAKTMLENADEENRSAMEELVQSYEEALASMDDTYWMISPASIDAYRSRQDWIRPLSYDFTANMVSDGQEGAGGFYDLVEAFARGEISADELLSQIDKKVQMMRLEGN